MCYASKLKKDNVKCFKRILIVWLAEKHEKKLLGNPEK